jgi:hypothetical protein
MNIEKITTCRACGSKKLHQLFSLGEQHLTGVFPAINQQHPPKAPLELVLCKDCTLVQLLHSCDPALLYGPSYGYRSGLNKSMREHLSQTARSLCNFLKLKENDIICDIGCNDGTLLNSFDINGLVKIGIDPLANKFADYHVDGLTICSDFFSQNSFESVSQTPAKLITSLSMFYDLQDPVAFVRDISACLEDNGVWYFEQSYLKLMLDTNSYDTICHEHLEYYSFTAINHILEKAGMKIIDATLNSVNGGSMAIFAAKSRSIYKITNQAMNLLAAEGRASLDDVATYERFMRRCDHYGEALLSKLKGIKAAGQNVAGYGASTKGNVLLQYLKLSQADLPFILEINDEKRGHVTPGTNIPIKLEDEVDLSDIDYLVVFPWHFRDGIIEKEKAFIESGGKFIFPLPNMEIFPAEPL